MNCSKSFWIIAVRLAINSPSFSNDTSSESTWDISRLSAFAHSCEGSLPQENFALAASRNRRSLGDVSIALTLQIYVRREPTLGSKTLAQEIRRHRRAGVSAGYPSLVLFLGRGLPPRRWLAPAQTNARLRRPASSPPRACVAPPASREANAASRERRLKLAVVRRNWAGQLGFAAKAEIQCPSERGRLAGGGRTYEIGRL